MPESHRLSKNMRMALKICIFANFDMQLWRSKVKIKRLTRRKFATSLFWSLKWSRSLDCLLYNFQLWLSSVRSEFQTKKISLGYKFFSIITKPRNLRCEIFQPCELFDFNFRPSQFLSYCLEALEFWWGGLWLFPEK